MTRMTALAVTATVLLSCAAQAQPVRHYYTDAAIKIMRENLAKFDWARKQRDEIIAKADRWAAYDDARLRTLVTPPQVPRCYDLNNQGCPVHGIKVYDKGLYKWVIDFDKPFKVKCPVGGEEYPSNDFAAYLASGMTDRSSLTGEYADDGWGWHKPGEPTPANYWFVAYYAHWSMRNFLVEAINNLSKAALVTENPANARVYAHKCALLLWQLAEHYPDYNYATQSREGKEHNPDYNGKLTNHIWEIDTPRDCAQAYDAIRPFLAGDVELEKLTGKSASGVDEEIRERLLMEAARCIVNSTGHIRGNYGMHQRSLLTVALVLDEKQAHPTSKEMIQWVVENPNPRGPSEMGLKDALINQVYRDGVPPESPSYNRMWDEQLAGVAESLVPLGIDFFQDPRFVRFLTWPFDLYVAGRFSPSIGDCGNMFSLGGHWALGPCRTALRHLPDPRFAWAVKQSAAPDDDLFASPIESMLDRSTPEPLLGLQSTLLPAYGIANLQCGSQANRVASSLYFSAHPNHKHADQLNIMLFAHDNALLTEIGYPEQTDAFNHRLYGYFTNTIGHNTVVVDGRMQERGRTTLHGFSNRGFAQVADASCEAAYPNKTSLYRRANVLVQATPEHSYLFDVFYVRGGKEHVFASHGTQADFVCEPPLGPVRETGSLAGKDVPYAQFYDDPDLKDKPLGSVSYTGYRGSGFQFLTNVQRAPLDLVAVCDWKLTEPLKGQPERPWKGIGLRAHMVGSDEEVIACDGPVQHYEYLPKSVKCLVRHRTGEDLASRFVSVFEPYKGKTWIKRVSPVKIEPEDGNACAAVVELVDGSKHYLFHSLTPEQKYLLDGRVSVSGQTACLVLDPNGKPKKAMLLNGAQLRFGDYVVTGKGIRRSKIVSVDYAKGIIEIADPVLDDVSTDSAVLVRGNGFDGSVTLRKTLDKTHFSIGDEDLRVGGGPVLKVHDQQFDTNVVFRHVLPGMTVVNSLFQPQGRFAKRPDKSWFVDRPTPLRAEDFPQAPGDSGPRFYVVMAGPGDEIWIPDCVVRE